MHVRIVVADRSEARFYDAQHANSRLQLVGQLTVPQAHLHDRDFKSDRPGRVFDRAAGSGRRGAVAHHATDGERNPLQHEAEVFAHRVAKELEKGWHAHAFERVVLMAEPGFLGELRQVIPKSLTKTIALQVRKDLVHQDEQAIRDHLPVEVFIKPF